MRTHGSSSGEERCAQDVIAATDVFHASGGGAAGMAADMGVPFLGRVPLDAALSRAGEEVSIVMDSSPRAEVVVDKRLLLSQASVAQKPASCRPADASWLCCSCSAGTLT